ncbi:MAG: adenosylcobinamide-GDP ribazoletransferase [Promethearchaeota archaeon]|nr:MAG: adenosylcobinamide-GDP ribazoletransferase [Candidatus Lokiarchaeota archaeon]
MFEGLKFCISFLTRIPIKVEIKNFSEVANKIWLFPIIGFIIGLILSSISFLLTFFLPPLLVSALCLACLIYITGAHHLDGLLDFGDGLMVVGDPQKKIDVMHDVSIGAGGFSLGFIVLTITFLSIAHSLNYVFAVLILSEIIAKFNMVAVCSIGKSVDTPMATEFIKANNWKNMFASYLLAITFALLSMYIHNFVFYYLRSLSLSNLIPYLIENLILKTIPDILPIIIISFLCSIIPLLVIIFISYRNFNGITGDCIGALNEITRAFSLIILFISFNFAII